MSTFNVEKQKTEEIVKNAFYLAWEACGSTFGLGILKDHPSASKEDIWENVACSGDYPSSLHNKKYEPYGDYVFGRMMKLGIRYDPNKGTITVRDEAPRPDYQGWCRKYKTYDDLIEAAIEHG